MTSLKDVIQSLLDALDFLSRGTKRAVDHYNSTNKQDHDYVTSNIRDAKGGKIFLGQGANACIDAMNGNFWRAQHATTKLSDFQLACEQTKKSLEDFCAAFDNPKIYYLKLSELTDNFGLTPATGAADYNETRISEYFLYLMGKSTRGYSPPTGDFYTEASAITIDRIRDDSLQTLYWDLDRLLTPGQGEDLIEAGVVTARNFIQGDFQNYQAQKHGELDQHKQGMDPAYYKDLSDSIDHCYERAMHYVDIIKDRMVNGYKEWVLELQAFVGQFVNNVATASDFHAWTVGDVTTLINAPSYKNSKVIILRNPDGTLLVVVKGGVDAKTVENDIQVYEKKYGIPSNTQISLFGYMDGGNTVQDVIMDKKYHVGNLILVGADLRPYLPLDPTTDVEVYQQVPNEIPDAEQEAKFAGLKPDQLVIPLAAGVALFFLTGGIGDVAEAGIGAVLLEKGVEIGTEYGISEVWNSAVDNWNAQHPGQPMPKLGADLSPKYAPELYVDTGTGRQEMSPGEIAELFAVLNSHGKLPMPEKWKNGKFSFELTTPVPDEPGSNSHNFTDSSYLNSQTIPSVPN